jgi:hypothetical protein
MITEDYSPEELASAYQISIPASTSLRRPIWIEQARTGRPSRVFT